MPFDSNRILIFSIVLWIAKKNPTNDNEAIELNTSRQTNLARCVLFDF